MKYYYIFAHLTSFNLKLMTIHYLNTEYSLSVFFVFN